MVWTDSQDYGADEILYTARTVLFDKTNRLMREIAILFGALPSCSTVYHVLIQLKIWIWEKATIAHWQQSTTPCVSSDLNLVIVQIV